MAGSDVWAVLCAALPGIVSGATLAIVTWMARAVMRELKAFREEHRLLVEAERNDLKAHIVAVHERATERGYITPMELESTNRMADSYFALGGNHYVHAVMSRLNGQMPVHGEEIPSE